MGKIALRPMADIREALEQLDNALPNNPLRKVVVTGTTEDGPLRMTFKYLDDEGWCLLT